MSEASYGDEDPIAALATPLAESALALIRTSGGGSGEGGAAAQSAVELVARVFSRPKALLSAAPNSVVHGWIVEPESAAGTSPEVAQHKVDEALVSVYRAPRSYTGEDGADISCHGGIATVKAVLAALKKAGFREALPGEFTFRAFMNGKLDLTRAESVMEVVAAKTNKGRELALRRLSGVLQREVSAIKALLVQVLAGTEIYLDYSEDEFLGAANSDSGADGASDEEAGRLPERALAEEAAQRLAVLAELWSRERLYACGALAVIAGRPNAGKSSLFNYLIREDRSIVTNVPGTTRDWIEASISVDDIPLRLADTAGLRNDEVGEAEQIGIQRSLELLDKAALALYVIDGAEGITAADREFLAARRTAAPDQPLVLIWNKADIAPPPPLTAQLTAALSDGKPLLAVSTATGQGIPELLRAIAKHLETQSGAASSSLNTAEEAAGPGTLRQKEHIDTALAAVQEALTLSGGGSRGGEPLDIIAPLFRDAINALGEITGEVSSEDIFQAMFSRFCVGK